MAGGVDLIEVKVMNSGSDLHTLDVRIVVAAENEFDAVGWLVEVLGKEQ